MGLPQDERGFRVRTATGSELTRRPRGRKHLVRGRGSRGSDPSGNGRLLSAPHARRAPHRSVQKRHGLRAGYTRKSPMIIR